MIPERRGPSSNPPTPLEQHTDLMWPWEHIAVAYITYSLFRRTCNSKPPGPAAVLAVVAGSLFPDLLDKPLEWWIGAFPSVSIGHSVIVAVPVGAVILSSTWLLRRTDVGVGFVTGHLLHVPCDMFYPLIIGGTIHPRQYLWPLYINQSQPDTKLIGTVLEYLADFGTFLASPEGIAYLLLDFVLLSVAFVLWVDDGLPVVDVMVHRAREAV